MLEAAYELLRTSPPFNRWKLPEADEVAFHVTGHRDRRGDHCVQGSEHIIRISAPLHSTLRHVLETVAHEMCHMRQFVTAPQDQALHGWRFKVYAKAVCRIHRFDLSEF